MELNDSWKTKDGRYRCPYCGKDYAKHGICGHIWRKHTNDGQNFDPNAGYKNGRVIWNKGLSKDKDDRVRKYGETYRERLKRGEIKSGFGGRSHTQETRDKISEHRRQFLRDNPDKVPYLLNHYSKGPSYPELYWIDLIKNENIDLSYHKQVGTYQLDFFNESKKIDLEIDGNQHYDDQRIVESDARRTEYLESLGWTVVRVRWSEWQKKSDTDKKAFVEKLKSMLL